MPYLCTLKDGTISIRLHVQPKSSWSRIVGLHDGCLKIAVAAPPVEGKANKAVVKFLADIFGVPVRDVTVKSGAQSRRKLIVVKALAATEIRNVVKKLLTVQN